MSYTLALAHEIRQVGQAAEEFSGGKRPFHTLFFGGGTPSLMTPVHNLSKFLLRRMMPSSWLTTQKSRWKPIRGGRADAAHLQAVRRLGHQSHQLARTEAIPNELTLLERAHYWETLLPPFSVCAGFANFSLDLIYGVPGQTALVEASLRRIALNPPHISLYFDH
ncbi:MAG: hypothetical protein R3E31_15035 [Chloroflexota bacterium]